MRIILVLGVFTLITFIVFFIFLLFLSKKRRYSYRDFLLNELHSQGVPKQINSYREYLVYKLTKNTKDVT